VLLISAEIVERPFDKETEVLVVFKQPVPEGMLVEEKRKVVGGTERKWVGEKGEEEREGVELPVSCIMLMRPE